MPNKTPAIISVLSTIFLLVVFAVLSLLFGMILLNGLSERQAVAAMGISLVCQGIGAILLGIFAGWLTNLTITKFNWNRILAVVIAVFVGTLFGGLISFLSIVIAVPVTGIR